MSDDNSNDVVMIEDGEETTAASTSAPKEDYEGRPLLQLFQRLIKNDNKQNTILTNAQIISILHKEFDIDITTLHELEVDIYLNIVKRFLKDWPQWEEFDRGINTVRKLKTSKSIQKILEKYNKNLKQFLKYQIDATRPLANEAVNKMIKENTKKLENVDTSNIVFEICCTRKQLNEFIFTCPNPDMENNIFNVTEYDPTKISLATMPMESILNWWGVKVKIELKYFVFTRSTMHQLKHTLVNRLNGPRDLKQELNEKVQIKDLKRTLNEVSKAKINKILDSMLHQFLNNYSMYSVLRSLFNIIKSNLDMIGADIKVPAVYRQYSNKYPYYRKLCKEAPVHPPTMTKLYDLYIEERLSPMHLFDIAKVGTYDPCINLLSGNMAWLTLECAECKTKFCGMEFNTIISEHFIAYHASEPNWTCTNCQSTFTMTELTQRNWYHDCKTKKCA